MARLRKADVSVAAIQAAGADEDGSSPKPANKTEAVRMAIAAGIDGSIDGAAFLQDRFGMKMTPAHFSSTKSRLKKMEGKPRAKRGRKPKSIEGILSPPRPRPTSNGQGDLLLALEALKPLVTSMGSDQVKRLVDLLG